MKQEIIDKIIELHTKIETLKKIKFTFTLSNIIVFETNDDNTVKIYPDTPLWNSISEWINSEYNRTVEDLKEL